MVRLPIFLVASLALHGAMAAVYAWSLPVTTQPQLGGVLRITLMNPQPAPSARPALAAIALHIPDGLPELPDSIRAQTGALASGLAAPGNDEAGYEQTQPNHLLGEIRSRLSRYLVYPPLARQRGWEGTVLLSLRVEPDGLLEHIRIRRSSGYDVLDRTAIESLRRVERVAALSASFNARGREIELPVIYRLRER